MALRPDIQKFGHTISSPESCDAVMKVMESASLVMFGAWLQTIVGKVPHSASDNIGQIGQLLGGFGRERQQINAGIADHNVPDELVEAAVAWDTIAQWYNDQRGSVAPEAVAEAAQVIVDALDYLHKRNMEHGTTHPRWTARLLTGTACKECGR